MKRERRKGSISPGKVDVKPVALARAVTEKPRASRKKVHEKSYSQK